MVVRLPEHLKSWPMTVGQGGSCSTEATLPRYPNHTPQGRKNILTLPKGTSETSETSSPPPPGKAEK